MMKENKLRRLLTEGKGSVATRILSPSPTIFEEAAATGIFDYLEFLAEYSPYDLDLLANIARTCELYDTGTLIKVDLQNRHFVAQKAMAAGFQAILFTDHKTVDEVKESIYMTMPDTGDGRGRMGYPNNRWIGCRGHVPQMDYAKMCADTVRIFMVEKKETMENFEAICKVPGVDMVQFGPSDFSMSCGFNFKDHNDEVRAIEREMIRIALANGVQPRVEIDTLAQAEHYRELGVKHFCVGDEVRVQKAYWNSTCKDVKNLKDAL